MKARRSHAEKPRTVVKVVRSLLRKGIFTRSDIKHELNLVADQITSREEADRVIRLAYELDLRILTLKREPASLLNEAAITLQRRVKKDVCILLPFRHSISSL